MNRVEERLIVTGAHYLGMAAAATWGDGRSWEAIAVATNAAQTDARDAYYTARDAAGPDREHRWITEQQLCERSATSRCVTCGAERDEP